MRTQVQPLTHALGLQKCRAKAAGGPSAGEAEGRAHTIDRRGMSAAPGGTVNGLCRGIWGHACKV